MDIFTPFEMLIGYAKHGRLYRIEWTDWNGYRVSSLLRQYKIHFYGIDMYKRDGVTIRCANINYKQAAWAEYILLRAGVPLVNKLIDPRNRERAEKHGGAPPAWNKGKKYTESPIEAIFDVVAWTLGHGNGIQPVANRRPKEKKVKRGR